MGEIMQAAQAAASLFGTYANVGAAALQNRWQRKHELEMYNLQRTHALEDWNRQNAYNHPLQQRQRLKEAGLNPNLVYGKGADVTAGPMRSTSMNIAPQQPLRLDTSALIQGLGAFQTFEKIDADTKLKKQQELYYLAQTAKVWGDVDKNSIQYKMAQDTYNMEVASMQADLMLKESNLKGQELDRMHTGLMMAQLVQQMDIMDQKNVIQLENMQAENDLLKQAKQLRLNEDQRKQLQSKSDLMLAVADYAKILQETLYTKERTQSEQVDRNKTRQEIINLQQMLENLDATRGKILADTELSKVNAAWNQQKQDWESMDRLLRVFTAMTSAMTVPTTTTTIKKGNVTKTVRR